MCATAIGVILYSIISFNFKALAFLPVAPIYFPKGTAFIFGCYEVNPKPIQLIIEYGVYISLFSIGILTKLKWVYRVFVILLILNIGGCIVAGTQDKNKENSNQNMEPTVKTPFELGNVQGTAAEL